MRIVVAVTLLLGVAIVSALGLADAQSASMPQAVAVTAQQLWGNANPNWVIALLTVGLLAVASLEWVNNRRSQHHSRVIERAYVALSHHPPGLDFGYGFTTSSTDKPTPHRDFRVRIEVRNHGNTPARVTNVSLRPYVGAELPEQPEYLAGPEVNGYLVKGNAFTVTRDFNILEQHMPEIAKGKERLWIYGYVDYVDEFGQRHRAGYARVWDPMADDKGPYKDALGVLDEAAYSRRNNLPFAVKPGYNYDRKRGTGEGKARTGPDPGVNV